MTRVSQKNRRIRQIGTWIDSAVARGSGKAESGVVERHKQESRRRPRRGRQVRLLGRMGLRADPKLLLGGVCRREDGLFLGFFHACKYPAKATEASCTDE